LFPIALLTLILFAGACVSIQSATVTNIAPDSSKPITGSEADYGILHLSKPSVDDLIGSLTTRLHKVCADGKLTNVRTVLSNREFIIFQYYEVQMTANCSSK